MLPGTIPTIQKQSLSLGSFPSTSWQCTFSCLRYYSINAADYFIYSVTKSRINEAKSEECRNFINKSLLLWGFNLLEKERLGGIDLRKALQKQIVSLCEELTDLMIVATDILVPSSHILGSVFGNEEGKMYEEYLNLIYSGKDTFTRVPYFGEITRR